MAIIADSHSPQTFDPTDAAFDHPADLSQLTAVGRVATTDHRSDSQQHQDRTCGVAVISGIGVERFRKLPRAASRTANSWETNHGRENLTAITRNTTACSIGRRPPVDPGGACTGRKPTTDFSNASGKRASMIRSFDDQGQTRSFGTNLMPLVGCIWNSVVCQPLRN